MISAPLGTAGVFCLPLDIFCLVCGSELKWQGYVCSLAYRQTCPEFHGWCLRTSKRIAHLPGLSISFLGAQINHQSHVNVYVTLVLLVHNCNNTYNKLSGSSPEWWLADRCGILGPILQVFKNIYIIIYCSIYVGNQFLIAVRHLGGLWYMANKPRLRAVSRHSALLSA